MLNVNLYAERGSGSRDRRPSHGTAVGIGLAIIAADRSWTGMSDMTMTLEHVSQGGFRVAERPLAVGLRRASQARGPEARPGEAGPDAGCHRAGSRGVRAARAQREAGCFGPPRTRLGQPRPIFSPPRPRRCGISCVENARRRARENTAAAGDASTPISMPSFQRPSSRGYPPSHGACSSSRSTSPSRRSSSSCGSSVGLTLEQSAACLGISLSTADRAWRYARAWLYAAMTGDAAEKC